MSGAGKMVRDARMAAGPGLRELCVLRAVSIWGAMAAAERRGFSSGWYTGANDMRRMLRDTRMVWAEVSR